MAYHLVQAGGEFRRNFPDKQEWVDIKKDFTCVVRAVARLFKELLIWAKNDEMGTVQIFDTGFGFQLKNLRGQGDPVVELKRLLSAVGEMYLEPAEREFLMKLVAVDNAVFEAAWRSAQESLKLEAEAEKLLKNLSREAKYSLDEQQDNNSDADSSLMSEEDYYVGILAKGGERLRNGLILNWPKSSPTVSANKPVADGNTGSEELLSVQVVETRRGFTSQLIHKETADANVRSNNVIWFDFWAQLKDMVYALKAGEKPGILEIGETGLGFTIQLHNATMEDSVTSLTMLLQKAEVMCKDEYTKFYLNAILQQMSRFKESWSRIAKFTDDELLAALSVSSTESQFPDEMGEKEEQSTSGGNEDIYKMYNAYTEQERKDLDMVLQNGMALRNIKEQRDMLCLAAARQNPASIQFIRNMGTLRYVEDVLAEDRAKQHIDYAAPMNETFDKLFGILEDAQPSGEVSENEEQIAKGVGTMADYKALLEDEKVKAIRSIVEIMHELGQEATVTRSCVLERYPDVDVVLLDSIVFEIYAEEDTEVQDDEVPSKDDWKRVYHVISSADGGLIAQERANQMAKERMRMMKASGNTIGE